MDGCTRSTTRGEFSYLMRWESFILHAASCISLFILCIILWFFIHVSHRSNKCVAVVIAAALYDPLPSIPSDRHLIQTVVNCCCCLQSCWFSNFCSALSSCKCLPKWSTVCWLVGRLVGCLQRFSCCRCSVLCSCKFLLRWSTVACLLACRGSPTVAVLYDVHVHVSSQVMMWSIVACLQHSRVAVNETRVFIVAIDVLLLLAELVLLSFFVYDARVCILPWVVVCCLQRFSTYCYSVWCSYDCPKWSTVACRVGSPILVSVWCSCMYLPMKWCTVACRGSPIRPQLCVCDMICSDLCELCVCGMICSDLCICSWQCVFFSHCYHVTSRSAHALLCKWMGCRIEC